VLFTLLGLGACSMLEEEPWERSSQGHHQLTVITGTTAYEAELDASGESGPLAGQSDTTESTLDAKFGIQLEYAYHLTQAFALGAGAGVRIFDPEATTLYGASVDPDEYTSTHLFLISRYYLPSFGAEKRWRPYLGLDLGYVPSVDLDVTVDYGGGLTEQVDYDGSSYWSLGMRAALAYLISDALSFELGTFYELPLSTSDATFTVDIPGAGSSDVDGELSPSGFVFFLGLAWHL
jgi:hypothetical protein